jgi:hypothetical protein
MKLDALVTMPLLIRFALSFLWFVVECGQKGHCHGQLGRATTEIFPCSAQGCLCVCMYQSPMHLFLLWTKTKSFLYRRLDFLNPDWTHSFTKKVQNTKNLFEHPHWLQIFDPIDLNLEVVEISTSGRHPYSFRNFFLLFHDGEAFSRC